MESDSSSLPSAPGSNWSDEDNVVLSDSGKLPINPFPAPLLGSPVSNSLSLSQGPDGDRSDSDSDAEREAADFESSLPSSNDSQSQSSVPRNMSVPPQDLWSDSDDNLPSDSATASSYSPSLPDVTFHGNPAGEKGEPSHEGK